MSSEDEHMSILRIPCWYTISFCQIMKQKILWHIKILVFNTKIWYLDVLIMLTLLLPLHMCIDIESCLAHVRVELSNLESIESFCYHVFHINILSTIFSPDQINQANGWIWSKMDLRYDQLPLNLWGVGNKHGCQVVDEIWL